MQSASFITLPLCYRVSLHYTTFHSFQFHSFQPIAPPHSNSLSSFHFTSHTLLFVVSIMLCPSTFCFCLLRQITKAKPPHKHHSKTTTSPQKFAHSIQLGTCFLAMLQLNTMLYFSVVFNPSLRCKK